MKNQTAFVFAMTVTAGLFFAGRFVTGAGPDDARPLADSLGMAILDDCRVRGRIESRTNGVFAVFDVENPLEEGRDIRFHYAASRTPAASRFSRMVAVPVIVKQGVVECRMDKGGTRHDVLLQEPASTVPGKAASAETMASSRVDSRPGGDMQPETWTLIIARHEIKKLLGWGAVVPAASDAIINMEKGEAVLASTRLNEAGR